MRLFLLFFMASTANAQIENDLSIEMSEVEVDELKLEAEQAQKEAREAVQLEKQSEKQLRQLRIQRQASKEKTEKIINSAQKKYDTARNNNLRIQLEIRKLNREITAFEQSARAHLEKLNGAKAALSKNIETKKRLVKKKATVNSEIAGYKKDIKAKLAQIKKAKKQIASLKQEVKKAEKNALSWEIKARKQRQKTRATLKRSVSVKNALRKRKSKAKSRSKQAAYHYRAAKRAN